MNINPIHIGTPPTPQKPRNKVWHAAKRILQKSYLIVPGAIVIPLYMLKQHAAGQPLWRIGATSDVRNMYGHMYAWGLWVGYEVAKENAIAQGISPTKASGAYLATMASGVLGAKALNLVQFSVNNPALLSIGGTWYGGLLGGLTGLYLFSKAAKVSFASLIDSLTPAAFIGLGIGRIGCWSAGCCQGEILGLPTEPVSAAFDIGLGLLLTKVSQSQPFKGKTALLGLMAYSLFRFTIEFFRHEPSVFSNLTLSQIISAGILTAGAVLYAKLSKKPPNVQPPAEAAAKTPPAPKKFFWARVFDLFVLPPLLALGNPPVSVIVGITNLFRAVKDGAKWIYYRLRGNNKKPQPETIS